MVGTHSMLFSLILTDQCSYLHHRSIQYKIPTVRYLNYLVWQYHIERSFVSSNRILTYSAMVTNNDKLSTRMKSVEIISYSEFGKKLKPSVAH